MLSTKVGNYNGHHVSSINFSNCIRKFCDGIFCTKTPKFMAFPIFYAHHYMLVSCLHNYGGLLFFVILIDSKTLPKLLFVAHICFVIPLQTYETYVIGNLSYVARYLQI